MTLALAACVTVLPSLPAVFSWGPHDPSSVVLRADDAALAVVEFHNTLTSGSPGAPFEMVLGDLRITVTMDFGAGTLPDTISVEVPEQYMVVPPSLLVPDFQTGIQRIYCRETMSLG